MNDQSVVVALWRTMDQEGPVTSHLFPMLLQPYVNRKELFDIHAVSCVIVFPVWTSTTFVKSTSAASSLLLFLRFNYYNNSYRIVCKV